MLATLLRPDAGSARVLGHDIVARGRRRARGVVSLTGQLASVDEDLTGRENLVLLGAAARAPARARAKARAGELLEAFGLAEAGRRGSSRTTRAACAGGSTSPPASWSRPQLMFLDEPTTGLDPRSRNQVWDIIRALVGEGTTILLCTQYLEEADQLADGIAVIDHGKVIAEGTPGAAQGVGRLRRAARAAARPRAARPRPSRCSPRELGGVQLEPDPAALSAPARTPTAPPRRSRSSPASGVQRRRLLARPAEPRRGLPRAHRPPRRGGPTTTRSRRHERSTTTDARRSTDAARPQGARVHAARRRGRAPLAPR